jgi:hypothetical protein
MFTFVVRVHSLGLRFETMEVASGALGTSFSFEALAVPSQMHYGQRVQQASQFNVSLILDIPNILLYERSVLTEAFDPSISSFIRECADRRIRPIGPVPTRHRQTAGFIRSIQLRTDEVYAILAETHET